MTQRSVTHASFTITRHWKASPERVFQAFADQEKKDRWFGRAPGLSLIGRSFDFREGGREYSAGRWEATGSGAVRTAGSIPNAAATGSSPRPRFPCISGAKCPTPPSSTRPPAS